MNAYWNTDKEYMLGMRYIVTKYFSPVHTTTAIWVGEEE